MRHTRDLVPEYVLARGERRAPVDDEVTRHARTRLGSLVRDRWRLDALLGVGGMAAVYAATHRNNGKRVAIKMLHPELSTSREVRQRFIDEGYAANRVGHPGAVSVLDDDVAEDGAAFLVMDLLEGETLEARLQRLGRLEPLQVLAITDALLDVLAAAHAEGIVHRDIKPDNIFITTEGVVMLLDFGIARMVMEGRPRTTLSGATMGTPAFMAPEQARGRWEDLDGRTDLWAVGATMFVQLTGRVVHLAETTNEELLCAMTKPAPPLGEIAPQLPAALQALVDRTLAFEQRERWSDARAMQAQVRAVYAQLQEGGASIEAHQPEPIPSTSPLTFVTPHQLVSNSERAGGIGRGSKRLIVVSGLAAAAVAALMSVRAERPPLRASTPSVVAPRDEPTPSRERPPEPRGDDQPAAIPSAAREFVSAPELAGRGERVHLPVAASSPTDERGAARQVRAPSTPSSPGRSAPARPTAAAGRDVKNPELGARGERASLPGSRPALAAGSIATSPQPPARAARASEPVPIASAARALALPTSAPVPADPLARRK